VNTDFVSGPVWPAHLITIQSLGDGRFQVIGEGRAVAAFGIQATADFLNWTMVGSASASADGRIEFTVSAVGARRFFRLIEL
jgi:hypothetical protein